METHFKEAPFRIVLWGIGKDYNAHLNLVKYWEEQKQIKIIALTAQIIPNIREMDGWQVIGKETLQELNFDYILICNQNDTEVIVEEIMALGIERKKILFSRVLDIPYFKWEPYIRILESRLSIVSCNCWGGLLYKTLGMECLSPFKNLWMDAGEMLMMIPNLKEYMAIEPVFSRWEVDSHSMQKYPVMKLGDMDIHFNHDTDIEEALAKWRRRKNKINYDNLLVMIYTEDETVIQKFIELEGYRKICFVSKGKNGRKDSNIWEMDLFPGQTELWEVVNSSVGIGGKALSYNVLSMLEGEKQYRYK